jgi:hypothetical protein
MFVAAIDIDEMSCGALQKYCDFARSVYCVATGEGIERGKEGVRGMVSS